MILLRRLGYVKLISRSFCTPLVKTAGFVALGDELLRGEVVDSNSPLAARRLRKMGIKLKKVSVVGDAVDEIVEEVKRCSAKYDYVITSGGIGPTHDDNTFEAVAKAFNLPLVLNDELAQICREFYGTVDEDSPGMKLAKIPQSATLTFPDGPKRSRNYPNICVKNVYMFPGIPQLFEKSFKMVSRKLFEGSCKFYMRTIYLNVTEDQIATQLETLQKSYPKVEVGCYPRLQEIGYKVRVSIESCEKDLAEEAYLKLLEIIPEKSIVET